MSVLHAQGLVKRFGDVRALNDVSFEVEEGEIFGFLGPNGAGKSTAIRCMMDFIRPSGGSITIFGKDAHSDSVALKQEIGYVPAEPNLNAGWTVDEHIHFVADVRGVKTAASYKLKKGLNLDGGKRIKHLSTGNQQKLAIILGLMGDPKLLILDEPTRGLDPLLQAGFHQLLRDFKMRGGTVFLSSHNLPEVDELCTRVAIIREGKPITQTGLEELKAQSSYSFRVVFEQKIPDLKKLDLLNLSVTGHTAHFRAKGDVSRILKSLSMYPIKDIEVSRATLEELFMELY